MATKKKPAKKPIKRKNNGQFAKGKEKTGGRQKGTPNKLTRDVVQLILETTETLEEEKKSLLDIAREDPRWFYQNMLRAIVPKNIELKIDPTKNAMKFAQMALRNRQDESSAKK